MQLIVTTEAKGDRPGADPRAQRLRALIGRKRSEKQRLERDIDDTKRQLAELDALRRRVLDPVDDEVHGHFRFVLDRRAFTPPVLEDVRQLYRELMWSDTITRRPLPGDAASDAELDAECSCPHCQGAIDDDDDYDHAGADPFGAPPGAAGGGRMPGTDAHGRVHAPRRPDGPHSLRKLYRELATRFHPDKADDEASRAEHERLMREINSAYDARDLDALARLSQELGFEVAGDGLLETLAVQYERLKAEIRALRAGRFGQIVVELRRCARDSEPPPFEVFANDIHARASHLGRLAQVFRGYRSGRLSKASFLAQLFPMSDDDDDDDDDLDLSPDAEAELLEVITALASALAPAMARGAKPQTKRNRNKRRRKRR